jgi:hypothetical protein
LSVQHGWNRLTCQQRNRPHVARKLPEGAFSGAAKQLNQAATARYFGESNGVSPEIGTGWRGEVDLNSRDPSAFDRRLALARILNGKGPSPFEPGPSSRVVAKLLLDLRLARLCRRPITFAETLAASAIAPLEETRSQVVAPAIAANQLVRFRIIADRFPQRSCGLGFSRCSFLPERLLTGRLRRVHQILFGRRSGTSDR